MFSKHCLFVILMIIVIMQMVLSNTISLDESINGHNVEGSSNARSLHQQPSLFEKLKTDWSNVSLEGFCASFSMIIVSEIGDKTFFIAAVLAMKHSRFIVWLGAASALFFMTILAVVFGSVFQYFPLHVTQYIAGITFFAFGFKLLRDARNMKGGEAKDELREVEQQLLVEEYNKKHPSNDEYDTTKHHDIELGNHLKSKNTETINPQIIDDDKSNSNNNKEIELGDIHNNNNNNNNNTINNDDEYAYNPKSKKRSQFSNMWDFSILMRSFVMTFISEIGDRSQIATVVLAAHKNPYGVTLGASSGHAICTGIAVIGGKMLASRISEKNVAIIGSILFLLFGLECFIYAPSE